MIKKCFFNFLFLTFFANLSLLASNALSSKSYELDSFSTECNAPAPDNFQIIARGSNYISLTWVPIYPEASHSLGVFKKDSSGSWQPQNTPIKVQGDSYMASNLEPGVFYRFIIATYCDDNKISPIKDTTDGPTIILELTIGGRTPINPVVADCNNIDFQNYAWVGFMVQFQGKNGLPMSNLFEFEPFSNGSNPGIYFSTGRIKRVTYNHPIVATDEEGFWPVFAQSSVPGNNPFRMAHIREGGLSSNTIGRIGVDAHANSIGLCVDLQNNQDPWSDKYVFTALVSQMVPGLQSNEERGQNLALSKFENSIFVKNPFYETLDVTILQKNNFDSNRISLKILNIRGQVLLEYCDEPIDSIISFNLRHFPSGVYLLRIDSNGESQTLKLVKM